MMTGSYSVCILDLTCEKENKVSVGTGAITPFPWLSTLPPHSREYHFVNQLMTWTEAQSYCREHFTDLVTIYNSDINQLLFSVSTRISTWAWIGLYNDRYSWKWSMEGKLFYVGSTHEFLIWANSQPDCYSAKEYCVTLQEQTQMDDRPCGHSFPFLCYNAKNTSYILVKESRSWSAAQSYCRTYHTDLTSIRSKEEKSNIMLTLNGSGVQYVWIGLYRDPWAFWSDNTTSTFTNWISGQPDNSQSLEYCGVFYLMTGEWADGVCGEGRNFFCFTVKSLTEMMAARVSAENVSDCEIHFLSLSTFSDNDLQLWFWPTLSGLMLSEGLTDFRIRWRKVQSYHDDQMKKQDVDGDCKTED
ncbi:hypothetical protein ACER0C_002696 [Sarotherodon galilaeus]